MVLIGRVKVRGVVIRGWGKWTVSDEVKLAIVYLQVFCDWKGSVGSVGVKSGSFGFDDRAQARFLS